MAIEPVSSSPATETTPNAAAESTPKAVVQTVTSVTITGCLANDEDTFLLKDTSGADAPKARSWRSGFLKKRQATIALFDATNALSLPSYVGQRVAATGMLINHDAGAVAAASCAFLQLTRPGRRPRTTKPLEAFQHADLSKLR